MFLWERLRNVPFKRQQLLLFFNNVRFDFCDTKLLFHKAKESLPQKDGPVKRSISCFQTRQGPASTQAKRSTSSLKRTNRLVNSHEVSSKTSSQTAVSTIAASKSASQMGESDGCSTSSQNRKATKIDELRGSSKLSCPFFFVLDTKSVVTASQIVPIMV